jgi:hypothetical protein
MPDDIHITFSPEEKDWLLKLLEISLVSKRVEVHRTDSLAYRRDLEHEVDLAESVLEKLRPGAKVVSSPRAGDMPTL